MAAPWSNRNAWSAALRAFALLVASALATTRCASGACELNSDCNLGTYCGYDNQCRYDCFEDRDCNDGSFCNRDRGRCQVIVADADAGATPKDVPAGEDAGADAGMDAPAAIDAPTDLGPPRDAGTDTPVVVDAPTAIDAPVVLDAPVDSGSPPVDLGAPADLGGPADLPPADAGPPPGRGAYLDPCARDEDCASGECLTTVGGARFCTRRCVATPECGDGFLCDSPPAGRPARCVLDDTGVACDARTAVPCARFCVGNPVNGLQAHCTRECRAASDCPAGYGCLDAGGGQRVCISAEQPCTRDLDCTTNLCVGMGGGFRGCTSRCQADADCPRRMTIRVDGAGRVALPPYRCALLGGVRLCVPPIEAKGGDLSGSNALGASCGPGVDPLCRSGVCDAVMNVCVQGCTPAGGCPSGFACRPWIVDSAVYLVCRSPVAGSAPVNGPCAAAADCVTGLCLRDAPGPTAYCSRYCIDGLCPTGMRCMQDGTAYDGTRLALCRR